MATVAKGRTFVSGETVTPSKLNDLVDLATVTGIVNADIDAAANISPSKLASGTLPAGITIAAANITDGSVTGAAGGGKIAASAITGQTTIADALADTDEFLVHDASASALRKVAYSNIAPTVTASKLNGVAKDGSGNNLSAGTAPIFGCRAWVNFDGTRNAADTGASTNGGTVKIRASGNVTSVTKNATGDYTVTIDVDMPDANYAVVGTSLGPATSSATILCITSQAAGSVTFYLRDPGSGVVDRTQVNVAIFR